MIQRQMLRRYRKPLIVMTPKSLLRHPMCISSADEVMNGRFETVLDEADELNPQQVERIVLCSGKVYFDLLEKRRSSSSNQVAILRVEQLYPFPHYDLERVLDGYPNYQQLVWCQEEPLNQGAWFMVNPMLQLLLKEGAVLQNVGRPASAAPAVGSFHIHKQQQQDLVESALGIDS
jgi:2-oxoglutarate dehydrogenase E1 component